MKNLLLNPANMAAVGTQAALGFVLLALLMFGATVAAETMVQEIGYDEALTESAVSVEPIEPLSSEELVDLVGPIALYPDDLIALVLPASTYPLQVVQAIRFLAAREDDAGLAPSEDWNDSIIALLNYPEVLELMDNDLDWTWKLGEAVLIQQEEVIAAISDFRELARVAGNLESDEHQVVEVAGDGTIEITLADPEVIYVPYYEPSRVTAYHSYPVYHYYPRRYPVYYYPYPSDYAFSTGYFWGVTSAFSIGWNTRHLHLHHYGYRGHPYYGSHYTDHHYYRRPHLSLSADYYYSHVDQHPFRHHAGNYWRPSYDRHGASPRHRDRYQNYQARNGAYGSDHDGHTGQRGHVEGGTRSSFAGQQVQQSEPLAADVPRVANRPQQRRRGGQLDRHKRATPNAARSADVARVRTPAGQRLVTAQTTNQGSLPSARVTREVRRADRPRNQQRRVTQSGRVATTNTGRAAGRKARLSSPRQPQQAATRQSTARQSAMRQSTPTRTTPTRSAPRRSAPRRSSSTRSSSTRSAPTRSSSTRPSSTRSAPRRSSPTQSRPSRQPQSRPAQQSRQVVVAATQSRGSTNRSNRAQQRGASGRSNAGHRSGRSLRR